jgi:hypothetical protein
VNNNLTANPITGIKPTRGVIKVISSIVDGNRGIVTAGLHAWATHVQKTASGYAVTESPFADSNLAPSEQDLLYQLCSFDAKLSGKPCTCTLEDQDF